VSEHIDLEGSVAQHIGSVGVSPPSDDFHDGLLTRAGGTRQRPRWLAILKEPPMRHASRVAVGSPTARVAALAAVTILVTVLGAGALVAGAQSPSPAPRSIAPEPLDPMGASYWTGVWTGPTIEASDPRISGEWVQVNSRATYPDRTGPGGSFSVRSGSVRIENADGAWAGTLTGFSKGDSELEWNLLEGQGAYEGLTAVFLWTWPGRTLEGVIVPAAFPEPPDPIARLSE
jgi:hypothetical protein